jgi:hypothetical protein
MQEGVIVERQPVRDLIENSQLGPPQQIGLPQCEHGAAQLLLEFPAFVCGQLDAFAAVKQGSNLHLAVDGALAAHLGRMGGQHRADQGGVEEAAQLVGALSSLAGPGNGGLDGGRLRRLPRQHPRTLLANVVLILGDIGEVGEIAEGTDNADGIAGRHAVENVIEFVARVLVLVAMEAHRGLPDPLDEVEHRVALLVPHGIAEDASQLPNIVAQLGVLEPRSGCVLARRPRLIRYLHVQRHHHSLAGDSAAHKMSVL